MENLKPEKEEEPPQHVLFRVMNHFASLSSEDGNGIVLKEGKDYSVIPDEAEELTEELAMFREILVRQEQTYNEEVKKYEKQIEILELELQQSEIRSRQLKDQNYEESRKEQDLQFGKVVEEYEKTVTQLVSEKTAEDAEFVKEEQELNDELLREREALTDIEKRFADLHMLYESQKQQKLQMEATKEQFEYKIDEADAQLQKKRKAYETLEEHARSQLERAKHELTMRRHNYQAECTRLKGISKKLDLKIESLEGMIEQKSKENKELTSIYDECLSKLDPSAQP